MIYLICCGYFKLGFSFLFILANAKENLQSCKGYFNQHSAERPEVYLSERFLLETIYKPEYLPPETGNTKGIEATNSMFSITKICGSIQLFAGGKIEIQKSETGTLPFTVDSTTMTMRSNVQIIVKAPMVIYIHGGKANISTNIMQGGEVNFTKNILKVAEPSSIKYVTAITDRNMPTKEKMNTNIRTSQTIKAQQKQETIDITSTTMVTEPQTIKYIAETTNTRKPTIDRINTIKRTTQTSESQQTSDTANKRITTTSDDGDSSSQTTIDFGYINPSFAKPRDGVFQPLNGIVSINTQNSTNDNDFIPTPVNVKNLMEMMEKSNETTVITISKPFTLHVYGDIDISQLTQMTYQESLHYTPTFSDVYLSYIIKVTGKLIMMNNSKMDAVPTTDNCGVRADAERSVCAQMDHVFYRYDPNVKKQMYLQCVTRHIDIDLETVELEVWLTKQFVQFYCFNDFGPCAMNFVRKMLDNPRPNLPMLPFLLESNVSNLKMEVINTGSMPGGQRRLCQTLKLILGNVMIVLLMTTSYDSNLIG